MISGGSVCGYTTLAALCLQNITIEFFRTTARPAVWLFPGQYPMLPMTTRQFNRAVHDQEK
jgi:hypothetical protein